MILRPIKKQDRFVWKELAVKKIHNKGNEDGVVAKVKLPKGTTIIYEGVDVDDKQAAQLWKKEKQDPKGRWGSYIIYHHPWRDAHPRYSPDKHGVGGKGLFIVGKINEPAESEMANARLKRVVDPGTGLETYAALLMRDVNKGEEITMYYGKEYERSYRVGRPYQPYSLRSMFKSLKI